MKSRMIAADGPRDLGAPYSYRPVTARPLYESVVEQIARQVVSGTLEPDTALPTEHVLAQQFGVSRAVIREAVRVLVLKGLVTVKQGSGTRVQSHDGWYHLDPLVLFEQVRGGRTSKVLDEALEVRRILEVEVAALAAQRRSDKELAHLRADLEGMARILEEPEAYTRLDIDFHDHILAAARNRLLSESLRPINGVLEAGRFFSIRQPGAAEESMRGHEQIYAAIEKRDADATREAMRCHVERFEHDIRDSFGSTDLTRDGG